MFLELHYDNLHSFLIYGFIGSVISYILVKLLVKLRGINNPQEVAKLMYIPLIIPFLAIISSGLFTNSECPLGLNQYSNLYQIIKVICGTGYAAGSFLTPYLLAGFSLALVRGTVSIIVTRFSQQKYTLSHGELVQFAKKKLEEISLKAGIKCPRIKVTKHYFARCYTFGYRNPTVVISQGVLLYFSEEELEAILAHEVGHIVRADSLKSWFGQILRDVLFFAPIVYFVFKDMKNEYEKAADDIAISLTGKPIVFAETLLKFWKYSPKGTLNSRFFNSAMEVGFARDISVLEQRVIRSINEMPLKNRNWSVMAHAGAIIFSTMLVLFIIC